ncbi:MAG: hypothetical protein IPO71_09000 [Nitrosomonas sp.]|nr:hypothetical protein [Nitrosomonas sp.]
MWDMSKDEMVNNWDKMTDGLSKMALLLESQGIPDRDRLPTNAVLAVIAALYVYIPETLDQERAIETLLKSIFGPAFLPTVMKMQRQPMPIAILLLSKTS